MSTPIHAHKYLKVQQEEKKEKASVTPAVDIYLTTTTLLTDLTL